MNVQFINPFLEGTITVLQTMAFIVPRAGKPYLKKENRAKGDISAIIGITGSVVGSLALSFSETCIIKIVSNMLGEDIKTLNGDIKDAVGEITNMVSGVARQKLEQDGVVLKAAIPTVVTGKSHTISHVLGGPSIIIPFETDDGPFVVDICFGESNGQAHQS
ncbi:MAG TPA: chemotaxis protein CheX [Deltaproteobacteria bacterium]|nr:chemotaxis protein CheX [Deltaproteobacteria bacterium]